MKTAPTFALIAALVAFVLFPINFALGGSALFAAGFFAIVLNDYRRASRTLAVPVLRPEPATATLSRKERFGLAA